MVLAPPCCLEHMHPLVQERNKKSAMQCQLSQTEVTDGESSAGENQRYPSIAPRYFVLPVNPGSFSKKTILLQHLRVRDVASGI